MRIGQVIGTVVMSQQDPAVKGGRWLVVSPLTNAQFAGGPLSPISSAPSVVVYDNLGAGLRDVVGFEESAEAAQPFELPTPVDAFCSAIVDTIYYKPSKS